MVRFSLFWLICIVVAGLNLPGKLEASGSIVASRVEYLTKSGREPGSFGNAQVGFSNVGLPPYLFPVPPSEDHIGNRSRDDRELCNDGKGFITGHWMLGLVLCILGIWCTCRMYMLPDALSDHAYFTRAFMLQFLFLVFFGVGVYGIISTTFKDCDEKANASRSGGLAPTSHAESPAPSPGHAPLECAG
jgi:hypothetical protein